MFFTSPRLLCASPPEWGAHGMPTHSRWSCNEFICGCEFRATSNVYKHNFLNGHSFPFNSCSTRNSPHFARDVNVVIIECANCEIPVKWEIGRKRISGARISRVNPFRLKCFQSLCRGLFEILILRWHRWWWRRRRRPCEWWSVAIFRHQIHRKYSTFELS